MPLSAEQIKGLAEPYKELANEDTLVEHRIVLNGLSEGEQRELATKLVAQCPDEELTGLRHVIEAIKTPSDNAFYQVVNRAFEVRSRIKALSHAPEAHRFLLGEEFNADLFNEFKELSRAFLEPKAKELAEKIALSTPAEKRTELLRHVSMAFRDTEFANNLAKTINLAASVKSVIAGGSLFKSPDGGGDHEPADVVKIDKATQTSPTV